MEEQRLIMRNQVEIFDVCCVFLLLVFYFHKGRSIQSYLNLKNLANTAITTGESMFIIRKIRFNHVAPILILRRIILLISYL